MDLRAENINWDCPAGRQLDKLALLLPKEPQLEITVFGSAPLQLCLDSNFLSQDIDVFSTENVYNYLSDFVTSHDLGQEKAPIYIQVCTAFAFRSALDWASRAVMVKRHHHGFRIVHPWDVLVSKLQRLDEKDLEAFELVITLTKHPTEAEFINHLQKAVDLYRPKFEEEAGLGDIFNNTRLLWHTLWQKEIDVRAVIIRPALERALHDYGPDDPSLKTRLEILNLPAAKKDAK